MKHEDSPHVGACTYSDWSGAGLSDWVGCPRRIRDHHDPPKTRVLACVGILQQRGRQVARTVQALDANLVAPPAEDEGARFFRVNLEDAAYFTARLFDACNGKIPNFRWRSGGPLSHPQQRSSARQYLNLSLQYAHFAGCGRHNQRACDLRTLSYRRIGRREAPLFPD